MPGFVNCHYHSELAVGPGHYQDIFERANLYVHTRLRPRRGAGPLPHDPARAREGDPGRADGGRGHVLRPPEHAALRDRSRRCRRTRDAGLPRRVRARVAGTRTYYAHEPNQQFLARFPAELAAEMEASPMGYAWPVEDVMSTYDHLVRDWDGRDDLVRTILAPDWTPACSDELYRLCRRKADEHGTGITSHVLETRSEMYWNTVVNGEPALRAAGRLGVLGPDRDLRSLRLGDRRGALHLRRQRSGRLEQPGLEPASLGRHLPYPGHHGQRRTGRLRHRRHLVLRLRGLVRRAQACCVPAARSTRLRPRPPRLGGAAAGRGRQRGAGGAAGGDAGPAGGRGVRGPAARRHRADPVPARALRTQPPAGRGPRSRAVERHPYRADQRRGRHAGPGPHDDRRGSDPRGVRGELRPPPLPAHRGGRPLGRARRPRHGRARRRSYGPAYDSGHRAAATYNTRGFAGPAGGA